MTTTFDQAVQKIEAALKSLETDIIGFVKDTVAPALEAEWTVLKPQILGLGETTLSLVWAAAETYLTGGASANDAIQSVVKQLPAELQALEHLVMAAFAGAVQSIQSKTKPAE